MWLLASTAFAGDLYLTSAVPVHVWVDQSAVQSDAGGVHVSGLVGVHSITVADIYDRVLAQTNVQVPPNGVRALTFDGVNLLTSAAAAPPTVVVMQAPAPPPPPPAPTGPTAMGQGAFSSLLAAVKGQTYGDEQVATIRSAAGKNWFTIDQVGSLIDALTYGSDQVTAVQVCAPKVVDPENAFALASHFTYSSDKEAALATFR